MTLPARRLGAAGVVLLVAAAALWSVADPRLSGVALRLDRDGSGRLEAEELGPVAAREFDGLDGDGSGAVDGGEFRLWLLRRWLDGRARPLAVPAPPAQPDAAALRAWLRDPVERGLLDGAALLVLRDGEVVFREAIGGLAADRAVPVAGAGRWLAAATFACLAEREGLALEAPAGSLQPRLPDPWHDVTLARMLSHTAGTEAPVAPYVEARVPVALAGRRLAETFPPTEPGVVFRPDDVSLQVAAWLAEAAVGRSWRRLFVECLAWPLSLESAAWGHALAGPASTGYADLGAGLSISLDDYGAFLSMLQQDGRYAGVRNLDAATLDVLAVDRIAGLPREDLPTGVETDWGHGLGVWCEVVDAAGRCLRMTAPGAHGALPWLDRRTGLAGIVLVVDSLPRTRDWLRATQALAELVFAPADPAAGAANPRADEDTREEEG